MGRITTRHKAVRFDLAGESRARIDTVAVEEPLEIRVGGEQLTVTMRTPGHDMELIHGFLLAEGVIRHRDDIVLARYCSDTETLNVVDVTLRDATASVPVSAQRNLVMHGGCGLCGKTTIDAVLAARPTAADGTTEDAGPAWTPQILARCAAALRDGQAVFERTGGVHAAGLFDGSAHPLVVREDIGRHNAVDKAIGWSVMHGEPAVGGSDRADLSGLALIVTSRASFEIVQKAAMAGIRLMACVSAPSSLAIEAAQELGLTLIGFLREDRMTAFTHPHRLQHETSPQQAQARVAGERMVTN
ncbi:formate dehydrogenase accessory sulfurtransferase FdhD [Allobranchiibius sp. GilTou38]|uniref:formate dehydrogenase accessory sulfurtransferase FdhD n=1 Tax=Allobranchiibius sp. GilTou38 TaxID=2815210 RepID=UPI001AA14C19|nr:formate dehydrogenase accessory sulfurtransferase FdhD [Allobranchiibius sp. GilTou38]MBO1766356.1 formate dehydrogenase accessory sulfurtransferase FdhD [Allobranchiibius sp. GilTou38]